ncbi:MAG: Transcriptional regulator, ArsR family / protein [Myxococcaceae bacterium]|nr:Transcriptional regulator, ArsR family / protein [Myxococcaceae bacterium]
MESTAPVAPARWELYRLLAEPVRLRLLALAAEEELAIGELAELLREGQPNVSRHVSPLRKAGLLSMRKHGTRVLVRLSEQAESDPVVADGVEAGRALCQADGSLGRVAEIVAQREESARAYFASESLARVALTELPGELPAYLTALAPLVRDRGLAVDAGCGAGSVLDVLAPVFKDVVAVDREQVQLALAAERLARRGYSNVTLVCDAYDSDAVNDLVRERGGADVVFASRVLHHAPKPEAAVLALAKLLKPEGALIVVDYAAHEDEALGERQADLWLGFSHEELAGFARRAGLTDTHVQDIGKGRCGDGLDSALSWHFMVARRPRVHAIHAHGASKRAAR